MPTNPKLANDHKANASLAPNLVGGIDWGDVLKASWGPSPASDLPAWISRLQQRASDEEGSPPYIGKTHRATDIGK